MKLHWSPRSPYVRKVMIVAHETGLAGRIECLRTVTAVTEPNPVLMQDNPLGKLPTLVLDDRTVLYDSPVVCEYLDGLHDGPRLFPADGASRLEALRRHALGDGLIDNLILWRGERMRPAEQQSEPHLSAYRVKTEATLAALEHEAPALAATPFGIGHIAIGCALAYLDFRFAILDWRRERPRLADWHGHFNERASVRATPIVDDS